MKDKICQNTEINMNKHIDNFKRYIDKIRVGSASKNLISNIQIKYYNKMIPLNQLADITVENYHTLIISTFDITIIPLIKKAILLSDLDLNPIIEKTIIRITIPPLSKERRHTLIKVIHKEAESYKILIRNVRRDTNSQLRKFLKFKIINKDEERHLQNKIQKITNICIKKIENILLTKEKRIIEI